MKNIDKLISELKVIGDTLSELMDNKMGHSRPTETMLLRWLTRIIAELAEHNLTAKKCCPLCPQSRQGKCGIDEDLKEGKIIYPQGKPEWVDSSEEAK